MNVFDLDLIRIEIGVLKKQKFSRNMLARPVMGTIFLVHIKFISISV